MLLLIGEIQEDSRGVLAGWKFLLMEIYETEFGLLQVL
jgi:hypothetical protein